MEASMSKSKPAEDAMLHLDKAVVRIHEAGELLQGQPWFPERKLAELAVLQSRVEGIMIFIRQFVRST